MRSFVCNYFSPGHHIPTSSHHLPTVKGVFETRAFQTLHFLLKKKKKEREGCQHLAAESARESKQLKGSGTEGFEGKMQGFKMIFFLLLLTVGEEKKKKASDSSDSAVHCSHKGRALLM